MTDDAPEEMASPSRAPQAFGTSNEVEALLTELRAAGDETRAAKDLAANRTDRECLGVAPDWLRDKASELRALGIDRRVLVADALWRSELFDARMLALRLLTQARVRPDAGYWALLERWVHALDCRALSDAAAGAIGRRLVADPARLDIVETWTQAANIWTRRTALAATAPWAKDNNPDAEALAVRERVLGWAGAMAGDTRPVIRQAVDGWLRDLGKRDAERVAAFRAAYASDQTRR